MSVEGPYSSHVSHEHTTNRPDVCPRRIQSCAQVAYPRYLSSHSSPASNSKESIMPVSTSSQSLLASLPSFMSVFGNGPDRIELGEGNTGAPQSPGVIHSKRPQHFTSTFARRDSASTFESTESSPTTTISTIESSITEPSPQSPPDSPDSSLPLPSFQNLRTNSVPAIGIMGEQERKEHFSSSFPTLPGVERADSPNKKTRNMKNLSVNTLASYRHGSQLPKLGLSNQSGASHAFSAPPTPAFIVPPKVPRKKPSALGLTITTPDVVTTDQISRERPHAIPQTPSDHQIRTLRALQTSTSGPLFSPTLAPEGGMRLPPFSNSAASGRVGKTRPPLSISPQTSFDVMTCSPITRQTLDHVQEEPDYDLPLSQEVKSPAYPQGPVCIYDPYVYLYLEPSHVEAREFDVVLNVAREVKNPFTAAVEQLESKDQEIHTTSEIAAGLSAGRASLPEPQTAPSEQTYVSPVNAQVAKTIRTSPTTPKAPKIEPEYVHVPWDHNTNVVDDLLRLCELIDDRARHEKRVLVHCQCGVSRSASLVVAYGLYKNPQLTVQEAYDAVKNRSRWIGPNMNLIYQLSEFKSKLTKTHSVGTTAWHSWKNNLTIGRPVPASILSPDAKSSLASSSLRNTPQLSLNASSQLGREAPILRASSFSPPSSAQLVQTSTEGNISPGPSSAPAELQFSPSQSSLSDKTEIFPGGTLPTEVPLPKPMDIDADKNSTSYPIGRDAIDQKEIAPAGAVANDLHEVAKDLDMNEHTSAPISPPREMDVDIRVTHFPALTGTAAMDQESDVPIPPTTVSSLAWVKDSSLVPGLPIPSPTLPAGFSNLLSRRQKPEGSRQLPSRHEPPRLMPTETHKRAFDPDVPPTPSLLSPRAAEFTASPFHRTAAGDLAGSSVFEQGLMSPKAQDEDPRSPAQRGEVPITRSIFDMI